MELTGMRKILILLLLASQPLLAQQPPDQLKLANYAYSVTAAGKEDERGKAIAMLCKTLTTTPQPEQKAFLISLLEICGDSRAVPALKQYFISKRLCDPATRALVTIGTPEAKVAILAGLKKAIGNNRLSLISALGQLRYIGAVDELTVFAKSKEPLIKKAALLALANIGDEDSEPVLAAAATKSHFKSDSTGATAAYLLYTQRLAQNWPLAPAIQAATKLIKSSPEVAFRCAALKVLVESKDQDANKILLTAVDDPQPSYRATAFRLAGNIVNSDNVDPWLLKAEMAQGPVRAGTITMLAGTQLKVATRVIKAGLSDNDPQVKLAAINAVNLTSGRDMLPLLLRTMKTADSTSVLAIRDALLHLNGLEVISSIKSSFPTQPPFAQAALKEVLAIRNTGE
jgi:HEAT repeat protein